MEDKTYKQFLLAVDYRWCWSTVP